MQTYQNYTVIQLSGHIIDSLTLAKVIDKIQSAGLEYQINDIQIGQHKQDASVAQLSIWGDADERLTSLLDELKYYGAHVLPAAEAQWADCTIAGTAPEKSYSRTVPPMQVLYQGEWQPVDVAGQNCVLVLQNEKLILKTEATLQVGDKVALAGAGIKILPQCAEAANV